MLICFLIKKMETTEEKFTETMQNQELQIIKFQVKHH